MTITVTNFKINKKHGDKVKNLKFIKSRHFLEIHQIHGKFTEAIHCHKTSNYSVNYAKFQFFSA